MWDLVLWENVLRRGLSKGSQPVFTCVSEKTTENSERLGRQTRPRIECGTLRLPVREQKCSANNEALKIGQFNNGMPVAHAMVIPEKRKII